MSSSKLSLHRARYKLQRSYSWATNYLPGYLEKQSVTADKNQNIKSGQNIMILGWQNVVHGLNDFKCQDCVDKIIFRTGGRIFQSDQIMVGT